MSAAAARTRMPGHDERSIYLVGFMGCGKTEVGRQLAERLGWTFADTDDVVRRAEGRSIEEVFRRSGEGYFREAEWRALQTLAGRRRLVVATGGGLFLGTAQRRFIREHGRSVWLDVTLERAVARVGAGAGRPLWSRDDPLQLRALFEKRRAAYALADVRIDVGEATPEELVARIVARVAGARG